MDAVTKDDILKYYDVLGVTTSTPLSQIRAARKRLLSEIHPDRFELSDPQRAKAEERAKEINQAFEGIRKSRRQLTREPRPTSLASVASENSTKAGTRKGRKRLETVESRIVVRDGRVVMIKRKREVKFAALKDLRDSTRTALSLALDTMERKLTEFKKQKLFSLSQSEERHRESKIIHIVEGKVRVERV